MSVCRCVGKPLSFSGISVAVGEAAWEQNLSLLLSLAGDGADDADAQYVACVAVFNLARKGQDVRAQIGREGGVAMVAAAMGRFEGNMDVQIAGCKAFQNLGGTDDEALGAPLGGVGAGGKRRSNKTDIATQYGGVALVMGAMGRMEDQVEVQRAGLWALSNLTNRSDAIQSVVGDAGAVDVCLAAMAR